MTSNRERILQAAIALFNASSAGAVSTNHIAAAAGISPGNLYYHFRNKEEIIRAVYERMGLEWDVIFALPADRVPTLADLETMARANFTVLWDYRFFYREAAALLQRDPELLAQYRARRRQGLADLGLLLQAFASAGVLRLPDDTAVIPTLSDIIWVLADFWLPYAEIGGQTLTASQTEEGVRLIMQVLRPYFVSTGVVS